MLYSCYNDKYKRQNSKKKDRTLSSTRLLLGRAPIIFNFLDKISLCSRDCPKTRSVDQGDLKFTEICLPLPVKC